jgi:hypothetical protein
MKIHLSNNFWFLVHCRGIQMDGWTRILSTVV